MLNPALKRWAWIMMSLRDVKREVIESMPEHADHCGLRRQSGAATALLNNLR
jgi:hypothetical protein